jgi:hypothetical protein
MGRNIARIGVTTYAYKLSFSKPEGKMAAWEIWVCIKMYNKIDLKK